MENTLQSNINRFDFSFILAEKTRYSGILRSPLSDSDWVHIGDKPWGKWRELAGCPLKLTKNANKGKIAGSKGHYLHRKGANKERSPKCDSISGIYAPVDRSRGFDF